jgi:cytoskeletal protein CcmA (bactofilin family)
MFKNTNAIQKADELSVTNNTIGKGTRMTGDMETHGNVRIEGYVIGNIKSKSKVALGLEAKVEGNILAGNAEIAGVVTGRLEISELLILKATAKIEGDIIVNKLVVEPGAEFNGACKMGVKIKEIKIGEAEEQRSPILTEAKRAVNA